MGNVATGNAGHAHRGRERRQWVGFNFHGGLSAACQGYSPLCEVGVNEYAAQPIYYGMLFTHLLGSGNLQPVTVTTPRPSDHVTAFALKPLAGGGLRVIAEDLDLRA